MVWSQQHTVLGALAKLFAVVACKHAGALCNIARFAWMIARRVVVQRLALFIHCGNGVVEEEEEEEEEEEGLGKMLCMNENIKPDREHESFCV